VYANSKQIASGIAADASGIGIASIAFAGGDLKVVAIVDAKGRVAQATPELAMTGDYPLGRYLQFYVRREPGRAVDPLAKEYMRLVFSREGQEIIAASPEGYLPLSDAQAAAELEKLQ
jgi:phosphate transport system substrate-binding protein